MMGDMELDQEAKGKKMAIREKVLTTTHSDFSKFRWKGMADSKQMPETWSLLARLTQKADLRQPQGSQVVFAFLLLLVESKRNPTSHA
jgi:hypothetical protein